MKTLLFILLIVTGTTCFAQKTGLKLEGILFINDTIKTCPDGYVWEIQSVLSRDETLKEIPLAKDETEQEFLFKLGLKMKAVWLNGNWYYPASFPFDVAAKTQVSSGNPKNYVVVGQYKIE